MSTIAKAAGIVIVMEAKPRGEYGQRNLLTLDHFQEMIAFENWLLYDLKIEAPPGN